MTRAALRHARIFHVRTTNSKGDFIIRRALRLGEREKLIAHVPRVEMLPLGRAPGQSNTEDETDASNERLREIEWIEAFQRSNSRPTHGRKTVVQPPSSPPQGPPCEGGPSPAQAAGQAPR